MLQSNFAERKSATEIATEFVWLKVDVDWRKMVASAQGNRARRAPRSFRSQSGHLRACRVRASAQAASSSLGLTVTPAGVRTAEEIGPMLRAFASEPDEGLIVAPSPFHTTNQVLLLALASELRLPAIYPFRYSPRMRARFYRFNTVEQHRGAASYVDRILKGEKPGDLPVQAPTKYDLVINLKTAKALGLNVSLQLQQRADGVIEKDLVMSAIGT